MNPTGEHHDEQHGHGQGHHEDVDWAAMGDKLEVEGEVYAPIVAATIRWIDELARGHGTEIRRILDVGSGPGVAICDLLRAFDATTGVAADGSSELLERAARRAASLGLGDRLRTCQGELPSGLDRAGTADLIWASMVLHHVADVAGTLGVLRDHLEPGGLLVISEFGDPLRFLPDELGFGRPGLSDRVAVAATEWSVDAETGPPGGTAVEGIGDLIEQAGMTIIGDRIIRMHLEAPLGREPRPAVLGHLQRLRQLLADRLDVDDLETLDVLIGSDERGVMRRADVFLDASRRVYVARADIR